MAYQFKATGLAGVVALSFMATGALATPIDLTYQGPSANDPRNVQITAAPAASGATTPLNAGAFGFEMDASDPGTGNALDSFLAWCLDIGNTLGARGSAFAYKLTNSPFSNSEGLSPPQLLDIQSVFDANYGTLDVSDGIQAAAFQVALWNVLYDENNDAGSGNFAISSDYESGADIIAQANIYLDAAVGNPEKKFNLTFYESTTDPQRQNLVSATPVPLPAAGLLFLGALGGLAALRRRKRAA